MLYLMVKLEHVQDRPRCIVAAQTIELLYQRRIYRAPSQMPVEFLLDTGPGSEKCYVRVNHGQPAHILKRAELTFKRMLYQYSKPSELSDSGSVIDCSFKDARLVEMPACQETVLSKFACITTASCEDHLANDHRIINSSKRGEVRPINHIVAGHQEKTAWLARRWPVSDSCHDLGTRGNQGEKCQIRGCCQ